MSTSETLATLSTVPAAPSGYTTTLASSNTSSTPESYIAVPTQSSIIPATSTLITVGTTTHVPYPTSVGTGHGHGVSNNNTVIATGTGASSTPAAHTTSVLIHPYTGGAGRKTEISFGLAAVFVGAGLYLM
jgi:hypothetical protein